MCPPRSKKINPRACRIRSTSVSERVNALRIHSSNGSFFTLYPKKWLRDNHTPRSLSIRSIQYCFEFTLQLGPATAIPSIPKPHSAVHPAVLLILHRTSGEICQSPVSTTLPMM
ncbi:hypothetical protein M9H77_11394 [Catharanthus roseus]|uniref:Uncharacterized protein n=1 Tax=Catharanthus roseus TaxID=4058 RepID=A0ACC0BEE1_CATRO|nr:hypothetical protein M9H77_11394 [Catharanthus roseus]